MSAPAFPIEWPTDSPVELLTKSTLLKWWLQSLDPTITVNSVRVTTVDVWPGPRVGFLEMDVNYTFNSHTHTERIMLSGASVSMVVLIYGAGRLSTLLVEQPRIGCGELTLEFPAGMVDDTTDYRGSAIRELEEECGLTAAEHELIDLGDFPIFPEVFDERAYVYVLARAMSPEEIQGFEGRHGGVDEEEQIVARIFPFDDIPKLTSDGSTLAVWNVVQSAIAEGKIPIPS
jgi:ADP-sugar diphosphatase